MADEVLTLVQGESGRYLFWCPACKCGHSFWTPNWSWNGSMTLPSVTPSLKVTLGNGQICHFIITDGKFNYCADCWHEMKNTQVPMVPWEKVVGDG